MKKCLVCKRELIDEEELCFSCSQFFKWKYGKKYPQKLREIKKHSQLNLEDKK